LKRKWLIIGVILLFIGTYIIPSNAHDIEKPFLVSKGQWLYVGGSGEGNYTHIQDALDNASDGDTVFVYEDSSPYREIIVINKSITLIGENQETTIIEGFNKINQHIVQINANSVHIHRFTIQNSTYVPPYEWYYAIAISSDNNDISENILTDNAGGILTINELRNKIYDNVIRNGKSGCIAIYVECGGWNEIFNNTMSNIDCGITIYDNPYTGSVCNKVYGNNIVQIKYSGIYLKGSKYIKLYKNYISNAETGIEIGSSRFCFVYFNEIKNCSVYGIDRYMTEFTFIMKNNLINNSCNAYFFGRWIVNKWSRNYWDDWHGLIHYTINGEDYSLDPDYHVSVKQFDWFPARKPYNIEI